MGLRVACHPRSLAQRKENVALSLWKPWLLAGSGRRLQAGSTAHMKEPLSPGCASGPLPPSSPGGTAEEGARWTGSWPSCWAAGMSLMVALTGAAVLLCYLRPWDPSASVTDKSENGSDDETVQPGSGDRHLPDSQRDGAGQREWLRSRGHCSQKAALLLYTGNCMCGRK